MLTIIDILGGEDLFFQEETAGWNGSFASLTASGHRANDNEMIQDLPRTLEEAGVSLLPPPLLLPSDSPGHLSDRYPRFEDASGYANVTVQLGGTAFLNCRVLDLQEKTVRNIIFFWFLRKLVLYCYDFIFRLFRTLDKN